MKRRRCTAFRRRPIIEARMLFQNHQWTTEIHVQYILEGMDEEDAKEKAHVKLLWAVRRTFFALYSKFLQESVSLENDDTHQKITSDLEKRVADGKPIRKAVQRVLAKHGPTFEGLFQYQEEEEEMEGTEESE